MGFKIMFGIAALLLYFYLAAATDELPQYDLRKTTTHHQPKHNDNTHQNPNLCSDDVEVAKMAISTLASMAVSLISMGTDPHNPQVVGSTIINIITSFINLVTFAMKDQRFIDMINEENFKEALRCHIIHELRKKQFTIPEID